MQEVGAGAAGSRLEQEAPGKDLGRLLIRFSSRGRIGRIGIRGTIVITRGRRLTMSIRMGAVPYR